jgi:hypothetical protein
MEDMPKTTEMCFSESFLGLMRVDLLMATEIETKQKENDEQKNAKSKNNRFVRNYRKRGPVLPINLNQRVHSLL